MDNQAYSRLSLDTLKSRLSRNLKPNKIKCFGVAEQDTMHRDSTASMTEILKTPYGLMMVPRFDTVQTPALRKGEPLDTASIELLAGYLRTRSDPVFLDIGASIGTFSFALRPYCKFVHAFEPQRVLHNMLCGSVALNGWNNVFVYHLLLNNQHGLVDIPQFNYNENLDFGAVEFGTTQQKTLEQQRTYDLNRQEAVQTTQLDFLAHGHVDLVKIDVNGMEIEVLCGGQDLVNDYKPILFINHTRCDAQELSDHLLDMKYTITDTGDDYLCIP